MSQRHQQGACVFFFKQLGIALLLIVLYTIAAFSFHYTPAGTTCILGAIAIFSFGGYVLAQNFRERLNQLFFVLSLSFGSYLVVVYLLYLASYIEIAAIEPFIRIFRTGNLLIPPLLIVFTTFFVESRPFFRHAISSLAALSSLPFVILNSFGAYIVSYTQLADKFVPEEHNNLYKIYSLITSFWICFTAALVFYHYYTEKVRKKRNQYLLYFLAICVAGIPGILAFIPAFGINWYPSFLGVTSTLFVIILGIAVIQYSLFEIKIVIRRTLPYAIGTCCIGIMFSFILSAVNQVQLYFETDIKGINWILLLILMGVGFEPILENMKSKLDRLLFRKEAQFDHYLADAGDRYCTVHSTKSLCEMTVQDVKQIINPEGIIIALWNSHDHNDCTLISDSSDENVELLRNSVVHNGKFYRNHIINLANNEEQTSDYQIALTWIPRLIISFGNDDFRGVIACQEKRSHLEFSSKDEIFLNAMAKQIELAYHRIRADRTSKSVQNLLKAIFDSMTNAITVLDENSCILSCNRSFTENFHLCINQKFSCSDLLDLRDYSSSRKLHEVGIEGQIWVYSVRDVFDENQCLKKIVVLTEITELRNLQEENQRKAALAELGTTISSINHEIQNILTPINVYVNRLSGSENEDALKALKARMLTLNSFTKELRDFYKTPVLNPRNIQISMIIESVNGDLRTYAKETWVEPTTSGLEIEIYADPQKCKQVFLNIMKNAWEAMEECEDKRWSISAIHENAQMAVIDIADGGIGIPCDLQHRLFQTFFSSKSEKGTGLGLPLAKRIIEAHGGTITIESIEGNGTHVYLHWPIKFFI